MRAEIYLAKAFNRAAGSMKLNDAAAGSFYLEALPRAFLYLDHGQKELILHFWSLQEADSSLQPFLFFALESWNPIFDIFFGWN